MQTLLRSTVMLAIVTEYMLQGLNDWPSCSLDGEAQMNVGVGAMALRATQLQHDESLQ